MSHRPAKFKRRQTRKQKRDKHMAQMTEGQKKIVMAFEQLDTFIGTLCIPVKDGSQLARLFGAVARAVDEELQVQSGINPAARFEDKPKLEAVVDEDKTPTELQQ